MSSSAETPINIFTASVTKKDKSKAAKKLKEADLKLMFQFGAFYSADADKSGSVTKEELAGFLADQFGTDAKEAEEAFDEFDTNKDGKLSMEEFLVWFATLAVDAGIDLPETDAKLDDAKVALFLDIVSEFDQSGDGTISFDEFKDALPMFFSKSELKKLDLDLDNEDELKVVFESLNTDFDPDSMTFCEFVLAIAILRFGEDAAAEVQESGATILVVNEVSEEPKKSKKTKKGKKGKKGKGKKKKKKKEVDLFQAAGSEGLADVSKKDKKKVVKNLDETTSLLLFNAASFFESDADKSGNVDIEELTAWAVNNLEDTHNFDAADQLARYDVNGDGVLDISEFIQFLVGVSILNDDELDFEGLDPAIGSVFLEAFAEFDANKSSTLSWSECRALAKKFLSKKDLKKFTEDDISKEFEVDDSELTFAQFLRIVAFIKFQVDFLYSDSGSGSGSGSESGSDYSGYETESSS